MADISKIKTPNNTEYNVKDAALTTEITNARGSYVNLDARLDNYDEVIGDIDTALNSLLVTLVPKTITENGVYDPTDDNADGYSSVSVDVPNTYTQADEGKVVSNGSLVSQTDYGTVTENGTYDTTTNNSVTVEVSGGQKGTASLISSPKTGLHLSQSSIFVYNNKIELLFVVNYSTYGTFLDSGSFVFDILGLSLPKQNYTCESYYGAVLSDSANNWVTYGNFTSAIYNNDILTLTITTSSARLYKPIVFQLTLV